MIIAVRYMHLGHTIEFLEQGLAAYVFDMCRIESLA